MNIRLHYIQTLEQEVRFVQEYWLVYHICDRGHMTTGYLEEVSGHPSLNKGCSVKISTVPNDKQTLR